MTDKYHEVLGLLHEAQEELKGLQKKGRPAACKQHHRCVPWSSSFAKEQFHNRKANTNGKKSEQ